MRLIEVHSPGLFTTVQDLGRDGYGPIGVSRSGAADPIALRLGNRLVGNTDGAAALEMTLLGGTFVFPQGGVAALTGGDFEASIPPWTTRPFFPAQTLRIGPARSGARCYLCVRGGIAVPLVMGSASTHILSGLGGLEGRHLRKGDVLQMGPEPFTPPKRSVPPEVLARFAPRKILRTTDGPQYGWFAASSRDEFYHSAYRVSEDSNRVGIRLHGKTVEMANSGKMITEGVTLGAIQIPQNGQPVILFVEQQTTGGYPKIANVISADIPSLGQLRPGDEIRFARIEIPEARRLLRQQEALFP
jgi:antagonist of KipI